MTQPESSTERKPPREPMDPEALLAAAKANHNNTVDLYTTYGSVDRGLCEGAGTLAVEKGEIAGTLLLSWETQKSHATILFPGQVIADLVAVELEPQTAPPTEAL